MTKVDFHDAAKQMAKAIKKSEQKYAAMTEEERKKAAEEAEQSRLWEDFSDVELKPQSDKNKSDRQ